MSLFSLTFESVADVRSADVDVWKELDLPLETGDAFPSFNFFSEKGPRRPTPKELEFVTIVLKALAATGEREIDAGRWSKSRVFWQNQEGWFFYPQPAGPTRPPGVDSSGHDAGAARQ